MMEYEYIRLTEHRTLVKEAFNLGWVFGIFCGAAGVLAFFIIFKALGV